MTNGERPSATAELAKRWADDARWNGITRSYSPSDVIALRGRFPIEHTVARLGAERLWHLLTNEAYVPALGAVTGGQAVQMVKAGLKAIYLSGWQVAAEANLSGQTYPDQSLYPANSAPTLVRRLNNALLRADQINWAEGRDDAYWLAPIVADAEAGFGGVLNSFELMKAMIAAGAAGVHFEDQLAAEKKCGHLGGKVLVPSSQFIRTLTSARLAADVLDVPTVLVARTDAHSASLITSDVDPRDEAFMAGGRTPEGFYRIREGIAAAIARGLAYAPFADVIWFETATPDLGEAREFAAAIHGAFPGKLLAYNCSPSFNWKKHLDDGEIAAFQDSARRARLPLPVRDAGWLPLAERRDVRAFTRLRRRRNDGVRAPPARRVLARRGRLHGHEAPAGSRRRLLRPRGAKSSSGGESSTASLPSAGRPKRTSSKKPRSRRLGGTVLVGVS